MSEHKGMIKRSSYVRKAHKRKAYTRKDGTKVKATHVSSSRVPSSWIKDRGAPGKGPKVIPVSSLKKAKLSKYGYSTRKSAEDRQSAIRKASREYGTLPTLRKLNALRTLQKSNPTVYAKLNSDVHYAQRLHNHQKARAKK